MNDNDKYNNGIKRKEMIDRNCMSNFPAMHKVGNVSIIVSGGSTISQIGGDNSWVWGKNLIFGKIFAKTAWKWKTLDRAGARVPGASLGSANICLA